MDKDDKIESLLYLIKKAKNGTFEYDMHSDSNGEWSYSILGTNSAMSDAILAFHGSLDAARLLHNALIPNWTWNITDEDVLLEIGDPGKEWTYRSSYVTNRSNPARAWLIAILEVKYKEIKEHLDKKLKKELEIKNDEFLLAEDLCEKWGYHNIRKDYSIPIEKNKEWYKKTNI